MATNCSLNCPDYKIPDTSLNPARGTQTECSAARSNFFMAAIKTACDAEKIHARANAAVLYKDLRFF
jgi:hypothetical protein